MKHRAGKKVYPEYPDSPLMSEVFSRIKLTAEMKSPRWKLAEATATQRRLLIGSGNLTLQHPKKKLGWAAEAMMPKGKPRTKAQKRAAKAAKERNK
jgi:hypothetical protein